MLVAVVVQVARFGPGLALRVTVLVLVQRLHAVLGQQFAEAVARQWPAYRPEIEPDPLVHVPGAEA